MATLSDYELQRLEHIKRNHEMLVRLGLAEDPKEVADTPKKPRAARAKAPPALPETLRRSSRVKQVAPDYTHETIDKFGDELDRQCEPKAKRSKLNPADEDGEAAARAEIEAATAEFLRQAREAMARFFTSEDGDAPVSPDGWRDEAVRRWGDLAGGGRAAGGERDWQAFVTSRLSKPPPPSPEPLLQEYYAADMWTLLCCCALMSRVSSWETKHRCVSNFFAAFPTPSEFLARVVHANETEPLREVIRSLGLFDDRLKSLCAITTAFLLPEKGDAFAVDLKEHKIRGIGDFGYQSWMIFCCDLGASLKPDDKCLASYCAWRKRQPAPAPAEVADQADGSIKVD